MSLLFIILNLSILYKIYSLRREKSKYLIYTAYIIFGVNVVYGIQWLLRELISTISLNVYGNYNKTHKIKVCVPVLMRFYNIEDFR